MSLTPEQLEGLRKHQEEFLKRIERIREKWKTKKKKK